MSITDILIEHEYQPTGSAFPRFTSPHHAGLGEFFDGPLFRVVEVTGADALGEPLPRLLVNFLCEFNLARQVLQGPSIIFWAQNRVRVVRIARNYIADSIAQPYYCLHRNSIDASHIILHCACCTDEGPCLICESNTQSFAFLFRAGRPRIRAHQQVAEIFKQRVSGQIEPALISYVAEFVEGEEVFFEHIRYVTLFTTLFFQDSQFAPEIRSIITRRQLITWTTAVEERRLRPYRQADRINRNRPDSLVIGQLVLTDCARIPCIHLITAGAVPLSRYPSRITT
jgi:hypothetical protein